MGIVSSSLFGALRIFASGRALLASHRLLTSGARQAPLVAPRALGPSDAESSSAAASLLQLWAVLAFLHLFERTIEFSVSWIPFYGALKLGAYVALIFPVGGVPAFLFDNLLHPLMGAVSSRVERRIAPALAVAILRSGSVEVAGRAAAAVAPSAELKFWDSMLSTHAAEVERELKLRSAGIEDDVDDDDSLFKNGSVLRRRRPYSSSKGIATILRS
jgi:hypothetical protein